MTPSLTLGQQLLNQSQTGLQQFSTALAGNMNNLNQQGLGGMFTAQASGVQTPITAFASGVQTPVTVQHVSIPHGSAMASPNPQIQPAPTDSFLQQQLNLILGISNGAQQPASNPAQTLQNLQQQAQQQVPPVIPPVMNPQVPAGGSILETLRMAARNARSKVEVGSTIKENEPLFVDSPKARNNIDGHIMMGDEPLYALGSRCASPVLKGGKNGKKGGKNGNVDFSVFSQGMDGAKKYPVAFDLLNKPKQCIPDNFWDLPNMNRKTGNLKKNKCSVLPVMTKEECFKQRFGSEKIVYELPPGASLPTGNEGTTFQKKKGKRYQKRKEVKALPGALFNRFPESTAPAIRV
jgi:hypothetical protein